MRLKAIESHKSRGRIVSDHVGEGEPLRFFKDLIPCRDEGGKLCSVTSQIRPCVEEVKPTLSNNPNISIKSRDSRRHHGRSVDACLQDYAHGPIAHDINEPYYKEKEYGENGNEFDKGSAPGYR